MQVESALYPMGAGYYSSNFIIYNCILQFQSYKYIGVDVQYLFSLSLCLSLSVCLSLSLPFNKMHAIECDSVSLVMIECCVRYVLWDDLLFTVSKVDVRIICCKEDCKYLMVGGYSGRQLVVGS